MNDHDVSTKKTEVTKKSIQGLSESKKKWASGKSKTVAGVFALLLGQVGIHKFYLGAWGWGIIYIVLVWTWIPAIIGLVEAIRYFTLSEDEFYRKVAALNGPFAFLW